jgi:hypothetical protein
MPRFNFCRKNNDCCETVTCCQPVFSRSFGHGCGKSCGNTCGNACADDCCGPSFFDKLRSKFRRNDCCCDSGCGGIVTGGCGTGCCGNGVIGVPAAAPAGAEPINKPADPPKAMPKTTGAAFNGTDLNTTRLGIEESRQPY